MYIVMCEPPLSTPNKQRNIFKLEDLIKLLIKISNQWTVILPEILMCLCCQGLEMFPPEKVKLNNFVNNTLDLMT